MSRCLERQTLRKYDLVVIGGGVYGMCAAWDAAMRGLSVVLLEKKDFAHACSSVNYKLIHGGLRYLQHMDFMRMRVSIKERRAMMRIAPHLVFPVEFTLPCYGFGIKGKEAMAIALTLNDLIGFDRNIGIEANRRIPRGHLITKQACMARIPGLDARNLRGGAVYYDAQMYSAERLAFSFGLAAASLGAVLINYAEVTGFSRQADQIKHVEVTDQQTGAFYQVAGRMFLNMTGPWNEITRQFAVTREPNREVVRSKGVQLITRPLSPAGFAIQAHQKDATAVISRGGRSLFVQPWRGFSFIGQSDTLFRGNPDHFQITESDIMAFIVEFNEAYPAARLTRADVMHVLGGMIPADEGAQHPDQANISHKFEIVDHRGLDQTKNLVSVLGVKFTVARYLAEKAVDIVARKLAVHTNPCRTSTTPVYGGHVKNMRDNIRDLRDDFGLSEACAKHLHHMHGSTAQRLCKAWSKQQGWLDPVSESRELIRGEVYHAVRHEMALHLEDVVIRRTDLGTLGFPGENALQDCADIMAGELGWSAVQKSAEIETVRSYYSYPAG